MEAALRIAVVVASLGRPTEIGQLLERLARQTRLADSIVLSVVAETDLPTDVPSYCRVVTGSKGLPAQRNRGMQIVLNDSDIVVFFDDDYVPSDRVLEGLAALFSMYPDVVGANGLMLADGIKSGGIDYAEAVDMVRSYDRESPTSPRILGDLDGLYGCNMAFRSSAIAGLRFDEALPLYGWQEDIDFSARLLPMGRLVMTEAFAGVHRGVKGARTSGVRLGYSQIVNPLYLAGKGTMRLNKALRLMIANVLANHLRALKPEPWVDRMGRVRGNWLAFRDLLTGRAHPTRILSI